MIIQKIIRKQETTDEIYTEITFKGLWTKPFTEICITSKYNIGTYFCKNGESIDVIFWDIVKAFLRTGEPFHTY